MNRTHAGEGPKTQAGPPEKSVLERNYPSIDQKGLNGQTLSAKWNVAECKELQEHNSTDCGRAERVEHRSWRGEEGQGRGNCSFENCSKVSPPILTPRETFKGFTVA